MLEMANELDPPEPEPGPANKPLRVDLRRFCGGYELDGSEKFYGSYMLPIDGGFILNFSKIEHIRFHPESNSLTVTTSNVEPLVLHGEKISIG
jgi:hypothetical protein